MTRAVPPGPPLTAAQRDELHALLEVSKDELAGFECSLRVKLGWQKWQLSRIEASPPTLKEARSRLAKIERYAKLLAFEMRRKPHAEYIVTRPGYLHARLGPDGPPAFLVAEAGGPQGTVNVHEIMLECLKSFLSTLDFVAHSAGEALRDDALVRAAYDAEEPSKSILRREVWPSLFAMWTAAGKKVAYSDGGPLERFVRLCHKLMGIAPPVGRTLREGIKEWQRDQRRRCPLHPSQ